MGNYPWADLPPWLTAADREMRSGSSGDLGRSTGYLGRSTGEPREIARVSPSRGGRSAGGPLEIVTEMAGDPFEIASEIASEISEGASPGGRFYAGRGRYAADGSAGGRFFANGSQIGSPREIGSPRQIGSPSVHNGGSEPGGQAA